MQLHNHFPSSSRRADRSGSKVTSSFQSSRLRAIGVPNEEDHCRLLTVQYNSDLSLPEGRRLRLPSRHKTLWNSNLKRLNFYFRKFSSSFVWISHKVFGYLKNLGPVNPSRGSGLLMPSELEVLCFVWLAQKSSRSMPFAWFQTGISVPGGAEAKRQIGSKLGTTSS